MFYQFRLDESVLFLFLVVGKNNKESALLTFTERKTREEIIIKIPGKKAENVVKALDKLEKRYKIKFYKKFKTITFDNGGEFRDWKNLEKTYDRRKNAKEQKCFMYIHIVQESGESMKI